MTLTCTFRPSQPHTLHPTMPSQPKKQPITQKICPYLPFLAIPPQTKLPLQSIPATSQNPFETLCPHILCKGTTPKCILYPFYSKTNILGTVLVY
uniref:Uncharacterized protein n=1 Tax=Anguilla anguilla TaxID=7936 RepID=A0A0E9TMC2_ANGAN